MKRNIVNRIVAGVCLGLSITGTIAGFINIPELSKLAWVVAYCVLLANRGFGEF